MIPNIQYNILILAIFTSLLFFGKPNLYSFENYQVCCTHGFPHRNFSLYILTYDVITGIDALHFTESSNNERFFPVAMTSVTC